MRNLVRLLLVLIYPLIILLTSFFIYRKYKKTIKESYKTIIFNTLVGFCLICVGLILFFHFEDTIYVYDYSGHWLRALTLRKIFFENPFAVLNTVYHSMNYYDYSYLPALFSLPFIIINQSYLFFNITTLIIFLMPSYILLQILYQHYIKGPKYLPLILIIVFYPLYFTLFYGKIDCCGLFFIIAAYSLVILPRFEESDIADSLMINLFMLLIVFLRRWYVYSVICFYIAYFIKFLFNKNFKYFKNLIASGIFALIIMVVFFRPFVINSLTNNFEETYAFYNHDGKLLSFINYISPIIVLVSLYGIYSLYKKDFSLLLINIVSIIIPCVLVWRIQSFEFHHYYIFLLNIIILFTYGFIDILNLKKIIPIIISLLLIVQIAVIFSYTNNTMPLFTNVRKNPEVLEDKKEIVDIAYFLRSRGGYSFISAGSYGIINNDLISNALLPDIDIPEIDYSVFDIRDGFPKDIGEIKYIITVDPIIYSNVEYQHMFTIIDDAIKHHEQISKIYTPVYTTKLYDKYEVCIYERTGQYTEEMKQYFYDEMLKYYPDKADYFSYILN